MKTLIIALLSAVLLLTGSHAWAASENTQQIADRYEQMLLKSPQFGAAFDKVIEWYSGDGGGVEKLKNRWTEAGKDGPTAIQYLILQGLLAERLRAPADARNCYRKAMEQSADPAAAAKLLAALETTEGNFPAAADAYGKALASESLPPLTRMELMRALALLYQRSFDEEKAGQVWKEALAQFPDDPYMLEEAGEAFLDAGDYPSARSAFSKLQAVSKADPFRKVAATLRLARTSELEGKTDDAVKTYELALEETSAGSWINREVRSRIEELFRRKDDLPGLLSYYERRTTAVPQDYLAVAAQSDVLADLGKGQESLERLRMATKLAPEDLSLRLKLIKQLAAQGNQPEALAEARDLAKPVDAPPEALMALGGLLWTNREADPSSRGEAIETWKRLAPADSKDPAKISQLAEILSSNGETDAAILEWKRLIELTPTASDARQRLAQIYLQKEDKKAASEVLQGLIAGEREKPENFLTLARIQTRLDWKDEARDTIRTALVKFPGDPELLNATWRMALDSNDQKQAADLLPEVWKSATNDFFAEDTVKRYVSFLEASGADQDMLETLAAKPAPGELEAAVLLNLAISRKQDETAAKALQLIKSLASPVRAARAASSYAQAFGTQDEQIRALQTIAQTDPRMAAESLKSAAKIQADSGKVDESLETLSQLIDHSPADSSLYGLYADIAIRMSRVDAATKRLQEGVRYAEDPGALRLQLATLLAAQGRSIDAERVLQEAFEAEQKEGKRTEIFRRQIELAMQSGRIEALISSLREKQSREEGGARYGTYLAEIFLLQGDFLSAREELAKSLGHNPDNPQAVSKLMDLADRGGDQEEGLRLSARLVELEPSRENRANYITRLFNNGEPEKGLEEFEKARADILKNPTDWNSALMAMRQTGYSKNADAIVEEIASSKSTDVLSLSELARLRLSQLNIADAEEILWRILNLGHFADALDATIKPPAVQPAMWGYPSPSWARFQSLGMISSEIQNSLQMMFQQNRGGYYASRSFPSGMMPGATQQATPEQRAVVRAFLLLSQLARVQNREKSFTEKSRDFLKNARLSTAAQFILFSTINDQESLRALFATQAAREDSDLETDRLFLASQMMTGNPESKEALEKIKARVEKADPDFAFQQEVSKLMTGQVETGKSPEERRKSVQAGIKTLLEHPSAKNNPGLKIQLASIAANAGNLDFAYEIYHSVKSSERPKTMSAQSSAILDQQLAAAATSLMMKSILMSDKRANAAFEAFLQNAAASSPSVSNLSGMRVYFGGMGRSTNLLAQESSDLNMGDSEFTVTTFRQMFPMNFASPEAEKVRAWFAERAKPGILDPYVLGLIYSEWFSGKKEDALKRIEAIHASNPTPRSAALLFEVYERMKKPAKALEIIELADLQKSETPDTRALRKIRLLRAAGHIPEAKEAAEKLARGRLSTEVRESLRNELNQLGVPANQFVNLSNNRPSRSSRDRSEQVRSQISKLVSDQKTDEAERMAVRILMNPFPTRDDYQTANIRRTMVDTLRSMKRLGEYTETLEQRLAADPGDFDSAVRLMEVETSGADREQLKDRISDVIASHPDRIGQLGYALQILQSRSNTKTVAAHIICRMLSKDSDLLFASGVPLEDVTNLASDAESALLLAETITGLNDDSYDRLFLPSRLTGRMSEAPFLNQMAEFCVQAGKKETAIALLKRCQNAALANLDSGLMTVLRLAELQLLNGDKEGAAATMTALFQSKSASRFSGIMGGRQNLSGILLSMMMNRMPGQNSSDQLTRLAKIATETGTLENLMKVLDEESSNVKGIGPALLLKTSLGRPGIADDWRKIVMDESVPLGFFNMQMISPVIKALAMQKDAGKLVPALLHRIPEQQFRTGGDSGLAVLAETLPVLAPYAKDPAVKRFQELLITGCTQDPNASQYLIHTEAYPRALTVLIEQGYFKEARTLLDFTKAARSSRNYGNEAMYAVLETRLSVIEGKETNFQILCAASPEKEGKTRVFWKVAAGGSDLPNDGNQAGAIWDTGKLPIPEKQRPVSLEIFAGPNPASLQQVAKTAKPGLEGSLSATLPGNIGLIQARWKLPDGSQQFGRLTAYVQGENLLANGGLPTGADPEASSFQTGQEGPLGGKSAVKFERLLPQSEYKIPLGEIALDGSPQILAVTGWMKASGSNGQLPQFELQKIQENGSKDVDNAYIPQVAPGQWRQFVKFWTIDTPMSGANSISKNIRKIVAGLRLQASGGYNSQFQVSGAWDGLGLFKFQPETKTESWDQLLSRARKSASAKDYASAVTDLVSAFHQNPRRLIEQMSSSLFETFEKAGKLSDLYTLLSEPALYLPDPLNNNSPALNSESFVGILARGALEEKAPPSAGVWLKQMASTPLNESMRFLVETAILREEGSRDSSKATPEKVLGLLGFKKEKVQGDRIQRVWSNSSLPALEILKLLETPEKSAAALQILSSAPVPTSLLTARKAIEAWLLAPSDPATALKIWSESLALRRSGENSVSFSTEADKVIFLRIAGFHNNPGDLVAAVTNWAAYNRSNPEYEKRQVVEMLYSFAKLETPSSQIYANAWADAEIAALKIPNYNPSRERISELAKRLLENSEWARLGALLSQSDSNANLNSQALQREFAQIRGIVAFAQGDFAQAWPVVWCDPGTNSNKVKISWQWNTKDIQPSAGKYDTAISVSAKPILPEIPNQTRIEFLFGTIPSKLTVIATFEGRAATGSIDAELPNGSGFLRAVAIVDGKRIPGPLLTTLSGKRIFPPENVALKDSLLSGPKPLTANQLVDSGSAPDGSPAIKIYAQENLPPVVMQLGAKSPAIRLSSTGNQGRFEFIGSTIPVEAGKFYVMRSWIRRAGDGSATLSGEFQAVKTSKAGSLNMLLSERDASTSQWALYTRAVPVIPQHTFWIPFREVESMVPRMWDMASGTEIAGWELLEIEDWAYAKWLSEITMLRESAGETPDAALLDKMLELSAVEPLTALDYHGEWLVTNLAKTGHTEKLPPLYTAALQAEPNPLFSRPKYWRIFNSLVALADNQEVPEQVRWDALEIALANVDKMDPSRMFSIQRRYLLLARVRGQYQKPRDQFVDDLFKKISEKNMGRDFVNSIMTNRSYEGDRAKNELLALMNALAEEDVISKFLKVINGDNGKSMDAYELAFANLALEACIPSTTIDQKWQERIDKAFPTTEKSNYPEDYMFWPSLLGELLISKKCDPAVIDHLLTKGIDRLLVKGNSNASSRQGELLRATATLAEYAVATGNDALLKETAPKVLAEVSVMKQEKNESVQRMTLRIIDSLNAIGNKEVADAYLNLVKADVSRFPRMVAAYSKYLPGPNASPTPEKK